MERTMHIELLVVFVGGLHYRLDTPYFKSNYLDFRSLGELVGRFFFVLQDAS